MGATAAIMTLAGVSTGLQFVQQQHQATALNRQADFGLANAEQQAADVTAAGQLDASRRHLAARQMIGAQRATMAANGVDVTSGTPVDLQSDEAMLSAADEAVIRNNAEKQARGILTQAKFDAMGLRNEATAARVQSYSTLMTGAANTYGLYQSNKNTKTKPSAAIYNSGMNRLPIIQRRDPRNSY